MASRLSLQSTLEKLLKSSNVYYQPPASVSMKYPAIVYSKSKITGKYADGRSYLLDTAYELIVIDMKPDNKVITELLKLPYCSHDRHYVSNNLHHDVLTIYY